jgi:hypothetical protein
MRMEQRLKIKIMNGQWVSGLQELDPDALKSLQIHNAEVDKKTYDLSRGF